MPYCGGAEWADERRGGREREMKNGERKKTNDCNAVPEK